MKLNIENKILIPIVLLFVVSQAVLLATSFMNDYNLIIRNQFRNMDASVGQLERSIAHSLGSGEMNSYNREEILDKISAIMKDNIIIEWNGYELLNAGDYHVTLSSLKEMGTENNIAHLQNNDYLFSYYYYAPLGWSMIVMADKKQLLSFFYESYKYNILTSIIFLTISLQITVFVAANITNPIKKLVKFCLSVGEGHKVRIDLNRKDEIGQLNEAFNRMLDQLDASVEELITVKNYNQNVLNSIEKGIITYNALGIVMSSNPFSTKIITSCEGYTINGVTLEANLQLLVKAFLDQNSNHHQTLEGTYEALILVHDQTNDLRYLDCYISCMRGASDNIQGYICSFNDVTERKVFERDVQRLERLATAGRLASGVAHEIRNPLTGMRTSMQVLKKRLGPYAEDKNISIINRTIGEIDRLNQMTSDLLEYAKPKQYQPSKVVVSEIVNSVYTLIEGDMRERSIKFETSYPSPQWELYVDADHLHQILLNVLKNAIEAIDNNGIIRISGADDFLSSSGMLLIQDNGIGMDSNDLEKIYDPFFTKKINGTGLGMSVVYELVNQNDGKIQINSAYGEGTQVILSFKMEETNNE